MLSRFRVLVTGEQRLIWSELLQWVNLIFIFFVIIQIAMAIGVWVVSSQVRPFLVGHNPDVLPSILLISSLLTIVVATVGYNGALHSASPNADERFFSLKKMMWFELIGSITAVLCLVIGITSFTVVHGDILWAAEKGLRTDIGHYSTKPTAKVKIDRLQTSFKCCGMSSYRDWFSIPWQRNTAKGSPGEIEDSVPWSCCSPDSSRPCVHFLITQNIVHKAYTYPSDLTLHPQGCVTAITKYLGHHMFYVCGGLMIFIGFALTSIVFWTRLLETSIGNAYTLGDPECTAWGYFIINYGPDVEDIYDMLSQSYDTYSDDGTYRSSDQDYQADSDLDDYTSEEVIAVSSPISLPTTLKTRTGLQGISTPEGTTSVTTTANDNNNKSPNNNDTIKRLEDASRVQQEESNRYQSRRTRLKDKRKREKTTSKPPQLPPPPTPPPLPPSLLHPAKDNDRLPPLPPLPFR